MKPAAHAPSSRQAVRAELEQLDRRDAELAAALAEIEHEARRCNDALERTGWRSGESEARAGLLEESRRAIMADRESIATRRRALEKRLAGSGERPGDKDGDD